MYDWPLVSIEMFPMARGKKNRKRKIEKWKANGCNLSALIILHAIVTLAQVT